ncbi:MAG: HlyC/CorC family transporter [Acidobacteria bacterium]|nr:MAG: HlyC/CorC family transporter [Acidobacteriota bacterium]REK01213.1 MAG: HlyC/CorC family transporter [Acidobacteriota bacterium]REK14169.1 MAG: HlyC/CorC family transporter [Acidobacteriota bacterium]REK44884.1 MAG: HlyC/CorC family transporter [Acidobacteriota bacterium]
MEIEIIIAVCLLLALTLLASVDMAFSQLSDVSLRRLFSDIEETKKTGSVVFLKEVSENRPRFRFALSSAIQILLIVFSVIVVLIVYRFYKSPTEMLVYSLLIGLGLSVLFRQVIPRFATLNNPEGKLLSLLPLIRPLYLFLPVIADPLEPSFKGREKTDETLAEMIEEDEDEDIQALIDVGEAEGIIEEEDRQMIETMIEFSDTRVEEVMTPRTEICGITIGSTVREARDAMIEEKFSRLPVFSDTIDNIEGVIYVRDILNAWAEDKESLPIEPLLRPAYFVPETKSVSELLKSMQLNHVQISIVIDEYGGVAGLVTVEDILEEIVGEIEDEDSEEELAEITEFDGGVYEVVGSTEIGKIERLLDMEIEDDDFTTIAGLITSETGYIPTKGESLSIRGLDLEILKADAKKIQLVRLCRSEDTEEEIGGSADA